MENKISKRSKIRRTLCILLGACMLFCVFSVEKLFFETRTKYAAVLTNAYAFTLQYLTQGGETTTETSAAYEIHKFQVQTAQSDSTLEGKGGDPYFSDHVAGSPQTFVAPQSGHYAFALWGGDGGCMAWEGAAGKTVDGVFDSDGYGGQGGIVAGTLFLTQGQTIYIWVGNGGRSGASMVKIIGAVKERTYMRGGGASAVNNKPPETMSAGGGGGGLSAISLDPTLPTSNVNLGGLLAVAGGGGGAGATGTWGTWGGDAGASYSYVESGSPTETEQGKPLYGDYFRDQEPLTGSDSLAFANGHSGCTNDIFHGRGTQTENLRVKGAGGGARYSMYQGDYPKNDYYIFNGGGGTGTQAGKWGGLRILYDNNGRETAGFLLGGHALMSASGGGGAGFFGGGGGRGAANDEVSTGAAGGGGSSMVSAVVGALNDAGEAALRVFLGNPWGRIERYSSNTPQVGGIPLANKLFADEENETAQRHIMESGNAGLFAITFLGAAS